MANPTLFWPLTDFEVINSHIIRQKVHIHELGGGQEQRITNELAWGPRSDGLGTQTTHTGRHAFTISIKQLLYPANVYPTNANLDNSVIALITLFRDVFYSGGSEVFKCFWFYNPQENDDFDTWTGTTVKAGTNSRGEAVDNIEGRYPVRFADPEISIDQIRWCHYGTRTLEFLEVAPESVT